MNALERPGPLNHQVTYSVWRVDDVVQGARYIVGTSSYTKHNDIAGLVLVIAPLALMQQIAAGCHH